jgi:hypothetical protein
MELWPGRSEKTTTTLSMAQWSAKRITSPAIALVLAVSLLLGACAATDTGKKDDPTFFGGAGAGNGGGGVTSGMSFRW